MIYKIRDKIQEKKIYLLFYHFIYLYVCRIIRRMCSLTWILYTRLLNSLKNF